MVVAIPNLPEKPALKSVNQDDWFLTTEELHRFKINSYRPRHCKVQSFSKYKKILNKFAKLSPKKTKNDAFCEQTKENEYFKQISRKIRVKNKWVDNIEG